LNQPTAEIITDLILNENVLTGEETASTRANGLTSRRPEHSLGADTKFAGLDIFWKKLINS
jgi:hypothetical protein